MRLGIFGGSFDPVHRGHLALAACCRDQAGLDQVWFVPAARQPLKPAGPQAADDDRCRMIELAIADRPSFRLCRREIDRGGTSYTVDTLRELHAERPDDELFLLMGADSLAELPTWHEAAEILKLAPPLVVHRAGEAEPSFAVLEKVLPPERRAAVRGAVVEMAAMPISSSEIRRRVGSGEPINGLTPTAVVAYIADKQLYRH